MPASVSIRPVCKEEFQPLAELLASSFHARSGLMGWFYPLLRLGIYEDLKSRLQTSSISTVCLVAIVGVAGRFNLGSSADHLLGTVEMGLRPRYKWWPAKPYLYLSNLAVLAEYRRQGIGQRLLDACEQRAREWGFSELYLHVLENNHSAKAFYLHAGYRLERVDWNWAGGLFGGPRQLLLRKVLCAPSPFPTIPDSCLPNLANQHR